MDGNARRRLAAAVGSLLHVQPAVIWLADALFACCFCRYNTALCAKVERGDTNSLPKLQIANDEARLLQVAAVGSLLFLSHDAFWLAHALFACLFRSNHAPLGDV